MFLTVECGDLPNWEAICHAAGVSLSVSESAGRVVTAHAGPGAAVLSEAQVVAAEIIERLRAHQLHVAY